MDPVVVQIVAGVVLLGLGWFLRNQGVLAPDGTKPKPTPQNPDPPDMPILEAIHAMLKELLAKLGGGIPIPFQSLPPDRLSVEQPNPNEIVIRLKIDGPATAEVAK